MPDPSQRRLDTAQDLRDYARDIFTWAENGAGWRDIAPHIERWTE